MGKKKIIRISIISIVLLVGSLLLVRFIYERKNKDTHIEFTKEEQEELSKIVCRTQLEAYVIRGNLKNKLIDIVMNDNKDSQVKAACVYYDANNQNRWNVAVYIKDAVYEVALGDKSYTYPEGQKISIKEDDTISVNLLDEQKEIKDKSVEITFNDGWPELFLKDQDPFTYWEGNENGNIYRYNDDDDDDVVEYHTIE